MARFVVLCIVIVSLCGQIKTYPLEPNASDIDDNGLNIGEFGNAGEKIFKLPTAVTDGMIILIKGILNLKENFITVVKSIDEEKNLCTIEYDFKNELIRVEHLICDQPPCTSTQTDYSLNSDYNKYQETTFALTMSAKRDNNQEGLLDVVFEANEHFSNGASILFPCPVKDFNNIGYIEMKQGVHQVRSILFNITSQGLTKI